jgi:hypothetical protein
MFYMLVKYVQVLRIHLDYDLLVITLIQTKLMSCLPILNLRLLRLVWGIISESVLHLGNRRTLLDPGAIIYN